MLVSRITAARRQLLRNVCVCGLCAVLASGPVSVINAARAHVHGQGELDISIDSGQVDISLIAPDADIRSDASEDYQDLQARFARHDLFNFEGAACQLESNGAGPAADLDVSWFAIEADQAHEHEASHDHEAHDEHEDHDQEPHADSYLSWTFQCTEDPGRVDVALFDLTGLTQVKVQAVGAGGSVGATLTADNSAFQLP